MTRHINYTSTTQQCDFHSVIMSPKRERCREHEGKSDWNMIYEQEATSVDWSAVFFVGSLSLVQKKMLLLEFGAVHRFLAHCVCMKSVLEVYSTLNLCRMGPFHWPEPHNASQCSVLQTLWEHARFKKQQ